MTGLRLCTPLLGCHWLSSAHLADVSELKRTWVDMYGRPQTVLKTAGPTSIAVHSRLLTIDDRPRQSANVYSCPQSSTSLAVLLAVRGTQSVAVVCQLMRGHYVGQDATSVRTDRVRKARAEDRAERRPADRADEADDHQLALAGRGLPQGLGSASLPRHPGLQAPCAPAEAEGQPASPSRTFKLALVKPHESRITTDRPAEMWGTDQAGATTGERHACILSRWTTAAPSALRSTPPGGAIVTEP